MATKRRRTRKTATGSTAQMTAMAMSAPFVMATRMTDMWFNALSPTKVGDAENNRMVSEKMAAGVESIAAVNAELFRQTMNAGTKMMTGSTRWTSLNTEAVANAALKPYSKRVKANARRLSKPK